MSKIRDVEFALHSQLAYLMWHKLPTDWRKNKSYEKKFFREFLLDKRIWNSIKRNDTIDPAKTGEIEMYHEEDKRLFAVFGVERDKKDKNSRELLPLYDFKGWQYLYSANSKKLYEDYFNEPNLNVKQDGFFGAAFIKDNKDIVIAFRGTEPGSFGKGQATATADFVADLKIGFLNISDTQVTSAHLFVDHIRRNFVEGNLKETLDVGLEDILKIDKFKKTEKEMYIAGHSLGGCLAQYAHVCTDKNHETVTWSSLGVGKHQGKLKTGDIRMLLAPNFSVLPWQDKIEDYLGVQLTDVITRELIPTVLANVALKNTSIEKEVTRTVLKSQKIQKILNADSLNKLELINSIITQDNLVDNLIDLPYINTKNNLIKKSGKSKGFNDIVNPKSYLVNSIINKSIDGIIAIKLQAMDIICENGKINDIFISDNAEIEKKLIKKISDSIPGVYDKEVASKQIYRLLKSTKKYEMNQNPEGINVRNYYNEHDWTAVIQSKIGENINVMETSSEHNKIDTNDSRARVLLQTIGKSFTIGVTSLFDYHGVNDYLMYMDKEGKMQPGKYNDYFVKNIAKTLMKHDAVNNDNKLFNVLEKEHTDKLKKAEDELKKQNEDQEKEYKDEANKQKNEETTEEQYEVSTGEASPTIAQKSLTFVISKKEIFKDFFKNYKQGLESKELKFDKKNVRISKYKPTQEALDGKNEELFPYKEEIEAYDVGHLTNVNLGGIIGGNSIYLVAPQQRKKSKNKAITECPLYLLFPFISKDGSFKEEIREEFVGSFLRSCYNDDGKYSKKYGEYYDLSSEIMGSKNFHYFPSNEKGDVINKLLRDKMSKRTDLPHYVSVMELLDSSNNKVLEQFYEIKTDENNDRRGILYIGHINSDFKFDKEKLGYSYNPFDEIASRAIEVPVFFNKQLIGVDEVTTSQVVNGAILSCDVGTAPLQLLVTSQSSRYISKELIATEGDIVRIINIMPQGTGCGLDKNKPCIERISPMKWQGCSTKMTIYDQHVLLNTSTCKCACGGTITIKDPKCKHIFTT